MEDKIILSDGIYLIDTRTLKSILSYNDLPDKLYILDSDPLTYNELFEFLHMNKRTINQLDKISVGFWPLKYIVVIPKNKDSFYILNRYFKKIDWKKLLRL